MHSYNGYMAGSSMWRRLGVPGRSSDVPVLVIFLSMLNSLSGTEVRELLLFDNQRTTWHHGRELCHSLGMKLLVTNSTDLLTAMTMFKEDKNAWASGFDNFWTGLHRIQKGTDIFYWEDCTPLLPTAWSSWGNQGDDQKEHCIRGKSGLNPADNWEAKKCKDDQAKVICERRVSARCSFTAFNSVIDNSVTKVTTDEPESLRECTDACSGYSGGETCWAVNFRGEESCTLYIAPDMTTVYDSLQSNTWETTYVRVCFTASVNSSQLTVEPHVDTGDLEPWNGCLAATTKPTLSSTGFVTALLSDATATTTTPTTTYISTEPTAILSKDRKTTTTTQAGTTNSATTSTAEGASRSETVTSSSVLTRFGVSSTDSTTGIRPQSSTLEESTTAPLNGSEITSAESTTSQDASTETVSESTAVKISSSSSRTSFGSATQDRPEETTPELSSATTTDENVLTDSTNEKGTSTIRNEGISIEMTDTTASITTIDKTTTVGTGETTTGKTPDDTTTSTKPLVYSTEEHASTEERSSFYMSATSSPRERTSIAGTEKSSSTVCPCQCRPFPALTPEQKIKFMENIVTDLTVDAENISATRRKYTSAPDPRPSAKIVGSVGVAFLSIVGVGLLLFDFEALRNDAVNLLHNLSRKFR